VIPLTGHTPAAEVLLGSAGQGNVSVDPVAARVLVKGEAVDAPSGRADNFAWPRTNSVADNDIEPVPEGVAAAPPRPVAPAAARAALPRTGQRPAPQPATTPARSVR
jgi:uncharacterized protein